MSNTTQTWAPYGVELQSRFLLGTAGYPSPQVLADSIAASGTQVVTVGLKRTLAAGGDNFTYPPLRDALIRLLQSRFERHPHRHAGIAWSTVEIRLERSPDALRSLGLANLVAVGIAKKEELIYARDRDEPIVFEKSREELQGRVLDLQQQLEEIRGTSTVLRMASFEAAEQAIIAVAAVQPVIAGATIQCVVALATIEDVGIPAGERDRAGFAWQVDRAVVEVLPAVHPYDERSTHPHLGGAGRRVGGDPRLDRRPRDRRRRRRPRRSRSADARSRA